jgi:hypothetical protein
VEDEPTPRFDRSAVMDRAVGRLAGVDLELLQQRAETQPGPLMPDPNSDRAIVVVDAHRDHCPLEAGVGHSGHRQKQLAGKKGRAVHLPMMRPASRGGNSLESATGGAYLAHTQATGDTHGHRSR